MSSLHRHTALGLLLLGMLMLSVVGCAPGGRTRSTSVKTISGRIARQLATGALKRYCTEHSMPCSRFRLGLMQKSIPDPDGSFKWLFVYSWPGSGHYDLMVKVTNLGDVSTTEAVSKQQAMAIGDAKFSEYASWEHSTMSDYAMPVIVGPMYGQDNRTWYYKRKHLVGPPYTIVVCIIEDGTPNVTRE